MRRERDLRHVAQDRAGAVAEVRLRQDQIEYDRPEQLARTPHRQAEREGPAPDDAHEILRQSRKREGRVDREQQQRDQRQIRQPHASPAGVVEPEECRYQSQGRRDQDSGGRRIRYQKRSQDGGADRQPHRRRAPSDHDARQQQEDLRQRRGVLIDPPVERGGTDLVAQPVIGKEDDPRRQRRSGADQQDREAGRSGQPFAVLIDRGEVDRDEQDHAGMDRRARARVAQRGGRVYGEQRGECGQDRPKAA